MLKHALLTFLLIGCAMNVSASNSDQIDKDVWHVIVQSVIDRDIQAMGSTYHPDAVVINTKTTAPISSTIVRWGEGMKKELAEGSSAAVEFRFSSRIDNDATAFEKGIFKYTNIDTNGAENSAYMLFEAVLVKKEGRWLITVENQLQETTITEWDSLQ